MSKTKDQSATWHFLAGLLIIEAGFWLLAFGELYIPAWMHHLLMEFKMGCRQGARRHL